jgi:tetratricopeptide (TPR) repeat protein
VSRITSDHKVQQVVQEPLSINIFNGQSTAGVNGKFVFSQVLVDCLLRLEPNEIDKKELIEHLKEQYAGNKIELKNIRDLKNEYSSKKVLWWYTRESFFYKTLNSVLRNKNIHMMFLFREFIADMQDQLQFYSTRETRTLYRGQKISKEELKTLEQNQGQLISVNSFFSTTTVEKQAVNFLNASGATNNLETVLFKITADPKMATKPFADISRSSAFAEESEVLFMTGSIFRLNSVTRGSDGVIWIIQMTLCSEDESDLRNVLLHLKQQLGTGETNLRTLGKLLWQMGEPRLGEQYYHRLLDQLPEDHHLRSELYDDIAKIASFTTDYEKSVQYYQKSLALKDSNNPMSITHTDESNDQNGKFGETRSVIL